MAQTPYGYGTAPGQSNLGYYGQETDAGTFGAAEAVQMGPQQYAQQQYGQAQGFANPYIGQGAAQVSGPNSVMGYAQAGQYSNPWLGRNSMQAQGVGPNPYGMGNPYLQQQIDAASRDVTSNFNDVMLPQLDRQMQQSGSFGNAGVQQAQGRAYADLGRNLGNISSGMRMQDYTQQQGLAENALNRNQANNQFNSSLSAGDLSRNMGGGFQQAGMNSGLMMQAGMFDAGNQFQGQQFNAGAQNQMGQFNAGLAQGQGQFNAGAQNQNSMFNAGQGNQMGMWNAGQGNQMNMFGVGQRNQMNQYNAGAANNMLENYRNRDQQQGQFDANLDWNIDQGNWNRMRAGQQDQIGLYDAMQRWGQNGVNNATTMQNMPLWYQQQFGNMANQYGQNGGTSTNNQQYQGNPWLGALAGWMGGNNWFGG